MSSLFYVWWILENLLTHYFAFNFLLRETRTNGSYMLPLWLAANAVFTFFAIYFRLPFTFLWDMLFLILFAICALKIRILEFTAPVSVLILLFTLKEGFSASLLSFSACNLLSSSGGIREQLFLSALLVLLFFLAQRGITARYSHAMRQAASSCLYLLILPCILFVFLIRFAMQLDNPSFEGYLSGLDIRLRAVLFLLLLTVTAILSLLLEVFGRIAILYEKEKQAALFAQQLSGQKRAVQEAQERNMRYASFQHDIENHLLILSGLLHEKQLSSAEAYLQKLRKQSPPLTVSVSTGSPALDALLREKFGYAESRQIHVSHSVKIPADSAIEDIDLCILFSNIFDNAVTACLKAPDTRFLSLRTVTRGHLLMIEGINSSASAAEIREGTGLRNIRQIAEKYQGTVEMEENNGVFRINILLCSPNPTTIYEEKRTV